MSKYDQKIYKLASQHILAAYAFYKNSNNFNKVILYIVYKFIPLT
jgi:hypothetical protein